MLRPGELFVDDDAEQLGGVDDVERVVVQREERRGEGRVVHVFQRCSVSGSASFTMARKLRRPILVTRGTPHVSGWRLDK